jgi:hypothetical protein
LNAVSGGRGAEEFPGNVKVLCLFGWEDDDTEAAARIAASCELEPPSPVEPSCPAPAPAGLKVICLDLLSASPSFCRCDLSLLLASFSSLNCLLIVFCIVNAPGIR